jgi:hypothetical protein
LASAKLSVGEQQAFLDGVEFFDDRRGWSHRVEAALVDEQDIGVIDTAD